MTVRELPDRYLVVYLKSVVFPLAVQMQVERLEDRFLSVLLALTRPTTVRLDRDRLVVEPAIDSFLTDL
jgi:hypothetical protein